MIGTEADETKAEHYLTKASDYGNTHASYQLARLYIRQESQKLSGESGTAPDYAKIAKAVKWLEESAAQEKIRLRIMQSDGCTGKAHW